MSSTDGWPINIVSAFRGGDSPSLQYPIVAVTSDGLVWGWDADRGWEVMQPGPYATVHETECGATTAFNGERVTCELARGHDGQHGATVVFDGSWEPFTWTTGREPADV